MDGKPKGRQRMENPTIGPFLHKGVDLGMRSVVSCVHTQETVQQAYSKPVQHAAMVYTMDKLKQSVHGQSNTYDVHLCLGGGGISFYH